MQHHAAFHQGLHCLLRLKQPSGTEIHHIPENSTCDPLDSPILIVSICVGKSTRIQRVKVSKKMFFSISSLNMLWLLKRKVSLRV